MSNKVIKDWNRVLITCPHNLGDFIAKLPFIRILKSDQKDCRIILCARSYLRDLVDLIDEVDEFVDLEKLFNQNEDAVVQELKDLKVDTIIHLLSVQNAIGPPILKYAQRAGIKNRVGNLNKSLLSLWRKKKDHHITHNLNQKRLIDGMHEFQWNLLPLPFFGIKKNLSLGEITKLLKVEKKEGFESPHINREKFTLIIHPGSHGNAKEWPINFYRELIDELDESKFNILITGSKEEAKKFSALKDAKGTFLMGSLPLNEFISLIQNSDGLLAASTGPVHIASLFSTKILALFPHQKQIGPTIWKPLGENATYLESPAICDACKRKLTDFNPTLCSCMEKITVRDVENILNTWRLDESSF
jgi:heptosyltransferase III